ncbi:MAG: hypothetical protein ACYCSN_16340 [Acidobacteriaceae bacterium]
MSPEPPPADAEDVVHGGAGCGGEEDERGEPEHSANLLAPELLAAGLAADLLVTGLLVRGPLAALALLQGLWHGRRGYLGRSL